MAELYLPVIIIIFGVAVCYLISMCIKEIYDSRMEQTQHANALLPSIREISYAYTRDLENINRQLSLMAEEQILMGAELHVLAAHFEQGSPDGMKWNPGLM